MNDSSASNAREADRIVQVPAGTLLNQSLNGYFLADHDGHLLQVNSACMALLGHQASDLIGVDLREVGDHTHQDEIAAALDNAVAHGSARVELDVTVGTGEVCHLHLSLDHMSLDQGRFFFGLITNIGERKRLDRALRESETRWRALAEGVNAALFIYVDNECVYVNPATSRMTGFRREELIGIEPRGFVSPDYLDETNDGFAALLAGETDHITYTPAIATRSGERKWVNVSLSRSEFSGQPAILGVAFDITGQIQAERKLSSSRDDLDRLAREMARVELKERRELGTILHDGLAQDIAASRLRLRGLQSEMPSDECRQIFQSALDLLDGAILQSRQLTRDLSLSVLHRLGLDAALAELCSLTAQTYESSVAFTCDRQPKPCGEETLTTIYRAASELLLNAVKHANACSIHMSSQLKDGILLVSVADDGKGFDLAEIRTTGGGTKNGTGLFMVEQRVNQLGGTLRAERTNGARTEVTISIPCHAGTDREPC